LASVDAQQKTASDGTWQEVRVSLGPDAEVTGRLSFSTPTRIEGRLKGELRATDLLVIGPSAVVHATVQADRLVVLGEVQGSVLRAAHVEICSGGRVLGDIETRALVIREGGVFEGHSRMGAAPAVASGAAASESAPGR
jgi:cytoskeletal protein CcmA (bactofilin family)